MPATAEFGVSDPEVAAFGLNDPPVESFGVNDPPVDSPNVAGAKAALEALSKPFVRVPTVTGSDMEAAGLSPTTAAVAAGANQAAASLLEGVENPIGVATLGLGAAAKVGGMAAQTLFKIATGGFAAQTVKGVAQAAGEVSVPETSLETSTRDILSAIAGTAITGGLVKATLAPRTAAALKEKGVDQNATIQKPIETGLRVEPQSGVIIGQEAQSSAGDSLQRAAQGEPPSGSVNAPLDISSPQGAAPNPVKEVSPTEKTQEEIQKEGGVLTPEATAVAAPEAKPIIEEGSSQPIIEPVGMGAAKLGEVATKGTPDTTGIAQRVREQAAASGQERLSPTGEGVSASDSVIEGEAILQNDPAAADKAMATFEADPAKAVSAEGIATGRAKLRQLALEARRTEEQFGTDSPEWKAAFEARSAWADRLKEMQTEWHKTGMAQQGEQDIDTGSFTGLASAFKDQTGKDFTPSQADTATKTAGKVKQAEGAAGTAKQELFDHLDKESGISTAAEKRALAAAHKTVREAAVRLAEAEAKTRVAKTVGERDTAKIQEDAARKAERAAQETVQKAAIRLAEAENKARIKAAESRPEDVQDKAARDALDAANKTVRDAAARLAEAENKARVAQAGKEKRIAQAEVRAAKKASDIANRDVRNAAIKAAQAATKLRVSRADLPSYAWTKAREYIAAGMDDFNDIVNKLATDLGVSVDKVRAALGKTKRAKFLTDDLFRKQQTVRDLRNQAKRWLQQTAIPGYLRAIQAVPRIMFGLKVGFHGTVALGTHAPMVAFQPRFWKTYFTDFGKMYRMVGSKAYHEMQVQDLIRRPNYITARRAGLVNDPMTYEDFNSPDTVKYLANMTGMGNRGYSVLKILRQDMFDQQWNQLPKTAQIAEMAKGIADAVNHATGVVKGAAPRGTNVALFAPRLEASRVMWLAGDPVRAANTFLQWKTATQAEKYFAVNQIKEKAWVAGTAFGLLALNQGVLQAIGSKQSVNFDDPMKGDFMKFKVAGMQLSYGNAMLTMARLPVRLYQIRTSDGGKLKNLVHPDESSYTVLGEYARSQLSPFASLASSLWFKADWQNRPLPNSNRAVPKRLGAEGIGRYTWPEFWSEQVLPIPAEEAVREVWKNGLGMSPDQIKQMRKAMATIAIMGATGARLSDDWTVK